MDKYTTWFRIGIGGSIIAALCCFTPILVVLLGVLGLSAWVGWLDYVLFPTLAIFIVITIYAWQRRRQALACCAPNHKDEGEKP